MPNATVRANARPMPETTDRRALLRGMLTTGAAVGAAVAAGAPAALAALPSPPVTIAGKKEAQALVEIGRRLPSLLKEYLDVSDALKNARARFDETAPLPPRPRKRAQDQTKRMFERPLVKIVGAPAPSRKPREVSPSHAYESLWDAMLRGENELARKEVYQVSDRYQSKLFSAAKDCGLTDALTRFRKAGHDLREVAAQAFEFKPETRLGVTAQAMALLGASYAKDGRVSSNFAPALAATILKIETEFAPDDVLRLRGELS
jgi:hypothetical protein